MAEAIGGMSNNGQVETLSTLPLVKSVSKTITYANGDSGVLEYFPSNITPKFVLAQKSSSDSLTIIWSVLGSDSISGYYNYAPGIGSVSIAIKGESNRLLWVAYNSMLNEGQTSSQTIGCRYILW